MKRPDLQAFLHPKHFHSSIELIGSTYAVELQTPDLSDCPRSVWGDWGPMYTFDLGEQAGVQLRYRCEARSVSGEREVDASALRLYSPMLWSQRQQIPFYLWIEDTSWGLGFQGYLDWRGRPVGLEVKTLRPEPQIAALLSGDLVLREAWGADSEHLRVA